jgi:hypothetical protein
MNVETIGDEDVDEQCNSEGHGIRAYRLNHCMLDPLVQHTFWWSVGSLHRVKELSAQRHVVPRQEHITNLHP